MKYILIFLILFSQIPDLSAKDKKKGSDYVKIAPLASHKEILAGSQLMLLFDFKMEKDWHIYWKNPGDTGLPTDIKLEIDKEFIVEDMYWAVPEKFAFDDMLNYGYEDSVRFIIPINIPKSSKSGNYRIKAIASYLVCKEECLSGRDTMTIEFTISDKLFINPNISEINLNNYPIKSNDDNGSSLIINDTLFTDISLNQINDALYYTEFYPEEQGYFIYSGITSKLLNDAVAVILPLDKFRETNPNELRGLLVFRNYMDHKVNSSFYINTKIKK